MTPEQWRATYPEAAAALRDMVVDTGGPRGSQSESADEYAARLAGSGLPGAYVGRNLKAHRERLEVLSRVEEVMGRLGGQWRAEGLSDTEMQRRWWQLAGVDVMSAQKLTTEQASKLLLKLGVDGKVNSRYT